MLGPIEGLKVLIEVDASRAQAVLREFSGTVVQTATTTNAATGSSISKFDDLFKQIDDTKRRAAELETSMRGVAAGASAAGAGAGALNSVLSSMAPILGAIVAIGFVGFLASAAMSTEEMKSAMGSLSLAVKDAKTGIGEMIVEATGLDRELRSIAGAIALISAAGKGKEGEFGADIWSGRSRPLIDWLAANAPIPKTFSAVKVGMSDEAYQADLLLKALSAAAAETKKFNAEQAKLAEQAARNKKATDALIASTERYAESLNREYWTLQGVFKPVDESTAKNQSKQEDFFGGGERRPSPVSSATALAATGSPVTPKTSSRWAVRSTRSSRRSNS